MFKKLALLLSSLMIVPASAVEIYNKNGNRLGIYGKIQASHLISDYANENGDNTYVRFGLRGETQISPQLTGYGNFQMQFQANKYEGEDKHSWTRLAFAGLNYSSLGSLDYGRNWGVMYDLGAWTDVLPEFGAATIFHTDTYMAQRATNLTTWRNRDFFGLVDGLNVALQYQGKNSGTEGENTTNNSRILQKQNGDGYGMSMTYDFDFGLSLGGVYTHANRTGEQRHYGNHVATGPYAEAFVVSAKYRLEGLYLAALYGETSNMTVFGSGINIANKVQATELVAKYRFSNGFEPSIGYLQSKGKDLSGYHGDHDLLQFINLGAMYYFNDTLAAYANYKINLLDRDNFTTATRLNTDDTIVFGFVYQL